MIHTLDLKEVLLHDVKSYKTLLFCDTESDKKFLEECRFGVDKLDILNYPNAGDYKEMTHDEIKDYIKGYYDEVLSKLNPDKVASEIRFTALVSDERTDSLAKRHIISEWLSLYTDEKICESGFEDIEYGQKRLIQLERPNFIKDILEEVIKESITNMRGFESLKALYLFEKGEKLEALADEMEELTGGCYDYYRQHACFYRCEADDVEEKYKNQMERQKYLKKHYNKKARSIIK